MRPAFLGFEMGRKGLAAAQKGLDITGQNLSNINTPGYTRQRIDQVSVSAYGFTSRNGGNRIDFAGQGVTITGVSQTRNVLLDRRFREEFSDNYYYQQKSSILGDISSVVDEMAATNGGLLNAINEISEALQGLTGDKATDRSCANILRTAFQGMVQTLHDYDSKLNKVATQQKDDLQISADDVNAKLAKLAGLNRQIVDEMVGVDASGTGVYGPNELLDSRNLLLDELSQYGDFSYTTETSGAITVTLNGHTVVGGKDATGEERPPDWFDSVRMIENAGETVSLRWNSDAADLRLTSGAMKASLEMINGRGPDIQSPYESPEKGILYYKDRADTLARTLANVMNSILPSATDPEGKPDGSGSYKALLGAATTDADGKSIVSQDVEVTAANINVSDEWTADVSYLFPNPESLTNSQYFSDMNNRLLNDKTTGFDTRGQEFTGSFRDYVTDVHSTCVGEESFCQGRLDAVGAIADQLLNERDSISGVNKDEETTNMLTYQKSFQALSRLITAMDEALDVIINKMGLVGR